MNEDGADRPAGGARFHTITGDDWRRALIAARQRQKHASDRLNLPTSLNSMRNISFMLTQPQVLDMDKDVTRRIGWDVLKPGDLLQGVNKGQGLKPGEKPVKLAVVRVVSRRKEPLRRMTDDPAYGAAEVIREGFPHFTPARFVEMFCDSHKDCTPDTEVNRIEFAYHVTAQKWAEFHWPPFVPAEVRKLVEAFWGEDYARSAEKWWQSVTRTGPLKNPDIHPRLGARVRCRPFYRHDGTAEASGRWVPMWNNIGRLILPDGTARIQVIGDVIS